MCRARFATLVVACVTEIRPRPNLGPEFHSVLVLPAIDRAANRQRGARRWMPLLWAADQFKAAQAEYREDGGTAFGAPPASGRRRDVAYFRDALTGWDEAAADEAISSLHQYASPREIFDALWRFGLRDYRDIGHKSIYLAGARRLIDRIAWRSALPVLRSLTLAVLRREQPVDAEMDAAWPIVDEFARALPAAPPRDTALEPNLELLQILRGGTEDDARRAASGLWRAGDSAPAWGAIVVGAAEIHARNPGSLVALHAVTTANALRVISTTADDRDRTRRIALLHAVGRIVWFRGYAAEVARKAKPKPEHCAALAEPIERATLADPTSLLAATHDAIVDRASESHDYKFAEAVAEDAAALPDRWRGRYLAAAICRMSLAQPNDRNRWIRALV